MYKPPDFVLVGHMWSFDNLNHLAGLVLFALGYGPRETVHDARMLPVDTRQCLFSS
jgi:hypothetical protein